MNKHHLDQMTLRDLDAMARADLLKSLWQLAEFFPVSPDRSQLEGMSDADLRSLVKTARRKFQQMGY